MFDLRCVWSSVLRLCAAGGLSLAMALPVHALDKITATTTWFAQAEHGGLYQALATGLYKKHGLDVTIRMGGPQVNGVMLLLAGDTDFIMNYDFAILQGVEKGLPLVTVAASAHLPSMERPEVFHPVFEEFLASI